MQDRAIADEFLKALCTVADEIEFSEASQSDLEPILGEKVCLLRPFFFFGLRTLFLFDLRPFFLLDGLVIFLLRNDAFVQQELQCAVFSRPREPGLSEQEHREQRNYRC
jgi:hypothetical protein